MRLIYYVVCWHCCTSTAVVANVTDYYYFLLSLQLFILCWWDPAVCCWNIRWESNSPLSVFLLPKTAEQHLWNKVQVVELLDWLAKTNLLVEMMSLQQHLWLPFLLRAFLCTSGQYTSYYRYIAFSSLVLSFTEHVTFESVGLGTRWYYFDAINFPSTIHTSELPLPSLLVPHI